MARPRVKSYWQEAIRALTENEPRLGPLGIQARLKRAAEESGMAEKLGAVPSRRTIGRIQSHFRQSANKDRERYREFRWPETMEYGLLPWEASRAGLELLRDFHQEWNRRPTVGLVECFWHVSQAAGDAPFDERAVAAQEMYARRVFGAAQPENNMRYFERYFAYGPWRSDTSREAWETSLRAYPIRLDVTAHAPSDPYDPKTVEAILGFALSDEERQAFSKMATQAELEQEGG